METNLFVFFEIKTKIAKKMENDFCSFFKNFLEIKTVLEKKRIIFYLTFVLKNEMVLQIKMKVKPFCQTV